MGEERRENSIFYWGVFYFTIVTAITCMGRGMRGFEKSIRVAPVFYCGFAK
jgi:hypothetical protein